jgi:alkylation response protein AidB-like acyl-CoA dehydrogenase
MSMIHSEEQQLLQQTAREFVREHAPVKHLRALRDTRDETGFSRALWKEMAELGWTGLLVDEEFGGSALGFSEMGILLEECGRTLAPEPLLSTAVLGVSAIQLGGSDPQRKEILTGVAAGETILALAYQESGRHNPYAVSTRAELNGDAFVVTGQKLNVLDGHVADRLIVVARTSGASGDRDGLTLLLIDPEIDDVSVTRTWMADFRNASTVSFDGARVPSAALLGQIDRGADILDAVCDRGAIAVSAELLGCSSAVFDLTNDYLKTREQFGVAIGTFQALKHRAALLFCELELSRSIVIDALCAIDEEREELSSLASTAKARLSDTASLATREGIQMHGGIGMTDEQDLGFYLKRAKANELLMGDAGFHRDRFGTLQGF